jgi:thioredoxin reductase (NADPH)
MAADVVLYVKHWCSYCVRAKALLDHKGAKYRECDVEDDPKCEADMIRLANGRTTVPQIFIDGLHVGGFDDLQAMDARGELDPLLKLGEKEEPKVEKDDVVIIGSGPAGLTAALYCARANLKPVVVEGLAAGGQLMATTDVENYPGFPDGIMGPDLMELFKKQAERFGTTYVPGDVVKVDFSKRPFGVWTEEREIRALSVIIATGASPRKLGVKGEEEYAGRGVSYCATCDGFFFRDKEIVVVGGGDSAMEEGLFLTKYGTRVTVVHRRDKFRASKIMADRLLANPKVHILWDSTVDEIVGDGKKIHGMRIRNLKTGDVSEHAADGFFVAIGHTPNTSLFEKILPMTPEGYLHIKANSSYTNIPGVFAAGDVHDHVYRQAITAAGAGCRAAIDCERWLEAEGR